METATAARVYYDQATAHWVAEVGGPGCPVARSSSKELLEQFLDYLDNRSADGSLPSASIPSVNPR
jgi:sulfite reductase beta subunit-like hemoprotein